MPVPSAITDLSTTAGSNSPAGTDPIGTDADNYIRAHAAFIAQLRDGSKNLEAGTATAPSLAFTGDTNTGIYSATGDSLSIASGGVRVANFTTSGGLVNSSSTSLNVAYQIASSTKGYLGTDNNGIISGGTGSGFGIRSEAELILMSNGVDAWRIDSTGRLKNPGNAQPSFSALRTTDQTSGSVVIFNSEDHDQGGVYNAGTGVFTAPVAGKYMFNANIFWRNNTGSSIQGTFYLKKNTTVYEVMLSEAFLATSNYSTVHCSTILNLSANDTVTIEVPTSLTSTVYVAGATGPSSFSGRLLG